MRKLLTVAAAVVFGGFAIVARLGMTPPGAIAAATCSGDRSPAGADTTLVRIGASIAAVDDGALAILQGDQETRVAPADQLGGAIRHVSSTPGVGTTYVRDRAGADVVVTTTSAGLRRFPAHGEALHPSLGSDGSLVWAQGAGLRLVGPGSDRVHPIAGPMRDGIAFSPRFDTDGNIVAGVVTPPAKDVPEDERLSNLWRYDAGSHRWTQLTRFSAGADRWSVVRTPFVAPDGSVEFIRVHGRASADRTPAFELWRVSGTAPHRVRSLPSEMYLAGFEGSARLWNLRDGATGSWRIDLEDADGSLRQVGCGAVAVDPLDRPDPDRRASTRRTAPPSRRVAGPAGQATTQTTPPSIDEILVGDFASLDAANDAAARIHDAFGSSATVIDSTQAPAVVRPGVWAVIVPVSDDPEGDLARFREALPDLADWSWIVSV